MENMTWTSEGRLAVVPATNALPATGGAVSRYAAQRMAVDFSEMPVVLSSTPIPRSHNPAYQHLASLGSPASRSGKRNLINIIAQMLGAPECATKRDEGDKRRIHSQNAAQSFDYVKWETLTVAGAKWLMEMLAHQPISGADKTKTYYRSASTLNAYRTVIRSIAAEAWGLGLVSQEYLGRIKALSSRKESRLPKGRAHPEDVIKALLSVCREVGGARGARDEVLILLMVLTGLRRNEACSLHLSDLNFVSGEIMISGKGNKERLVRPPRGVWDKIDAWLDYRSREPGALFVAIWHKTNSPKALDKPLAPNTVNARLEALRKKAVSRTGDIFDISPHDLRRTFATDLYNSGVDLLSIQMLLAHNSLDTTQRYLVNNDEKAREDAARVNANRFAD